MYKLESQGLGVRVLVGAVALAALGFVLFLCLLVYALGGAGQSLDAGLPILVGLGACLLSVAFFFQTGRRFALVGVMLCAVGAVGLTQWAERQRSIEAAFLRIGVLEPEMAVFRPTGDNPKLARLDAPASLQLSPDTLPRLDGATALYPLYAAFVQATWPAVDEAILDRLVKVSKTSVAYERLMTKEADVIFVARPSKAQSERARSAALDLHFTPVGREAFVFYVASGNTVSGLSQAQIRGIFSGAITNWRDVGGASEAIRAFQRPEGSGSQSMLEKIMGDTPPMAAPTQNVVQGMGGVVKQTSDYINYPGAIGYSFRVFVTSILKAGGIRLLAVDGVAPTEQTIADGSYPFAAEFYAATLGPPQGEIKRFIDWMQTQEGQALVERTGYVRLAGH